MTIFNGKMYPGRVPNPRAYLFLSKGTILQKMYWNMRNKTYVGENNNNNNNNNIFESSTGVLVTRNKKVWKWQEKSEILKCPILLCTQRYKKKSEIKKKIWIQILIWTLTGLQVTICNSWIKTLNTHVLFTLCSFTRDPGKPGSDLRPELVSSVLTLQLWSL